MFIIITCLMHILLIRLVQIVLILFPVADTPLGMACGRNGNIQCIMPLLSAGAHIDFRGKDGLTPMHRAAIGGNAPAVNVSTFFHKFIYRQIAIAVKCLTMLWAWLTPLGPRDVS